MIRKWLKLNSTFIEVLQNSAAFNNLDQKWVLGNLGNRSNWASLDDSLLPVKTVTTSTPWNITNSISFLEPLSNKHDRGDAESYNSEDSETVISETPVKTELFEVKGPNESAFLIEVEAKDLDEVKRELVTLKGDCFRFDRTVIEWFTIKCILRVEKPQGVDSLRDQVRLSKIHAISSGCDEVYSGEGKFFFVSPIDRTARVRKMLEKFGYTILEIMYRFQPREKVSLDDHVRELCEQFVKAVKNLPKVISVTHNL